MRFARPCEPLASVDVADLSAWIAAIDFAEWPQQNRLEDRKLRPAMVTDLAWHDFGERTDAIVRALLAHFPGARDYQRMLSAVMPGHAIDPHADNQIPEWIGRVHVPLMSNERAAFVAGGESYELRPGTAYLVNTKVAHEVVNRGETPRVHLMFDVRV